MRLSMNEHNLTKDQREQLATRIADLYIQAMIFDMDIDMELLTLVEKNTYVEPEWLARWKDKMENADYMADGSDDQEYDND